MRIGLAKRDITPRVGVELAGFGPFILRRSTAVREPLYARALALQAGGRTLMLISCDLIGVHREVTRRVRAQLASEGGLDPDAVMLHCTHTHSGPNTAGYIGWGAPDEPYLETLPRRIAAAGLAALAELRPATLHHAEVPCPGIGYNREYDREPEASAPPLPAALTEDWRPRRPELTDTACHVLRVDVEGRCAGFVSAFGCHPVVCCAATRQIHGDYCGVATNLVERDHAGAVGLFLLGANGDVNTCVVHQPEEASLKALDIIAERYARAVRAGLREARPVAVESLAAARLEAPFRRKAWGVEHLRALLAEQEALLNDSARRDDDRELRMATVRAIALRRLIAEAEGGRSLTPPVEMQGFRIGPILLLASPFETFQAIKNDVLARSGAAITLVLSTTNDVQGYAPDRTAAARGGYAADLVPLIVGTLPLVAPHEDLVAAHLAVGERLGNCC